MSKKKQEIQEDLRKWVKEKWVDIGAPDGKGGYKPCGRSKGEKRKGYPKCVPSAKARSMSKGEKRSAVKRKRAAGNAGPKPTMVKTKMREQRIQSLQEKLCAKGKAAAKRKFKVYPSAYANMYASAVCSGKVTPGGKKGKKNESILNTYAHMAYIIAELSLSTEISYIEKAHKETVEGKKDRSRGLSKAYKRAQQKEADGVNEGKKGTMPKKFSVKSGDKSKAGGLTAKGVARYRAANPGSKLKTAVTTKPSKLKKGSKAASRRKSFCARMGGMKKRLTSSKTANDPDSRINKALRKWNC